MKEPSLEGPTEEELAELEFDPTQVEAESARMDLNIAVSFAERAIYEKLKGLDTWKVSLKEAEKHLSDLGSEAIQNLSLSVLASKDFSSAKGTRLIDTLARLFDRQIFLKDLKRIDDPDFIVRCSLVLERIRQQILPVVHDLIHNPALLAEVKRDNEPDVPVQIARDFTNQVALDVGVYHQRKILETFREKGMLQNPEGILQCHPNIIELVFIFGESQEIDLIREQIQKALLAGAGLFDHNTLSRSAWFLRLVGFERGVTYRVLKEELTKAQAWFRDKTGVDTLAITGGDVKIQHWPETLGVIHSIEDVIPGGAERLSRKYGIHCFFRYFPLVLIDQLEEENENEPYGVVASAYHDYNDAFAFKHKELLFLSKQLRDNGTRMKIIEAGSGFELAKRLARFNQQFGEKNKISFLVVNAHGEETNFLLSSEDFTRVRRVQMATLSGKGVRRMKDYFVPNPEIVLLSCSTGAEGGIGEKIAKTFDAHVIAPKKPTGVRDISASFDSSGRPHFQVEFSDEGVLKEYGPESK